MAVSAEHFHTKSAEKSRPKDLHSHFKGGGEHGAKKKNEAEWSISELKHTMLSK